MQTAARVPASAVAFAVASVLADVEASADDGAEDDDVEDDDDADDDAVDEFDESPQPDSDRQRAAAAMGAIRVVVSSRDTAVSSQRGGWAEHSRPLPGPSARVCRFAADGAADTSAGADLRSAPAWGVGLK